MKTSGYLPLIIILTIAIIIGTPVSRARLYPKGFNSIQICDRNGELLREVLSYDHKTSVWVPLEKVTPGLVASTIIREDKRFLFHPGVDVLALTRAALNNLQHGYIHSGGSTITMQVAKMALNLRNRNIFGKIIEMIYALKLELWLTKEQILEVYLNRAPYGNQTYGVEAASRFYFGKHADQLSLAESCALVPIPKAPSVLNPYRSPDALHKAKNEILLLLMKRGLLDSLTNAIGCAESLQLSDKGMYFGAPHFVDYLLMDVSHQMEGAVRITTTIDASLQRDLQKLLFNTLESLKGYNVNQGAIVVMDVADGEILAMVGSKNYYDAVEGQVNGCIAPRQPGSSIKPFLYALALQSGMRLSDLLPDTLIEFPLADGTSFAPRNYSQKYHGPTRLREALASSFNVPAVYLIEKLGTQRFHELLKRLRFETIKEGPDHYGLSLSLGAAEVTLVDLVNAYRVFAARGFFSDFQTVRQLVGHPSRRDHENMAVNHERIFSEEVAYLVTDILTDNAGRFKAFDTDNALRLPFTCAVKTGTSKDYRDNWCIGYTTQYVVGVWVGNFDGTPMQGVSGISGAAPLFRNVMIELHRDTPPRAFKQPATLAKRRICVHSGDLARAACNNVIEELFIRGTEPRDTCCLHGNNVLNPEVGYFDRGIQGLLPGEIAIKNPSNGDIYKIDPHVSRESQRIKFKVQAGQSIGAVCIKVDGKEISRELYPFEYLWAPVPGKHVLEVATDEQGPQRCSVSFTVN
jgi:penicillin-binding protein 1C